MSIGASGALGVGQSYASRPRKRWWILGAGMGAQGAFAAASIGLPAIAVVLQREFRPLAHRARASAERIDGWGSADAARLGDAE